MGVFKLGVRAVGRIQCLSVVTLRSQFPADGQPEAPSLATRASRGSHLPNKAQKKHLLAGQTVQSFERQLV